MGVSTVSVLMIIFVLFLQEVQPGCVWDETDSEPTVECKLRILDFRRNSSDVVPANGIKNAGAIRMNIECSDVFFFESQLRSDHLGNLDRLQELDISYCKIRQLPPRSFVGLTRLRRLAIHTHNSDWPSLSLEPDYESLVGLDLLETLDLTYNNLQKLPPGLLCTLVNLKTVNVSHNSIEDLVDLGLSSFSIKDNKTTISSSSSSSCEISLELENLIVSNNGLKTATPGSFSALGGKIKKLILSRNQISVLVDDTFLGMENLEHIDISFNKLAALPPKIFKYTPKLTSIQLSNNTLGTISFNVFEGLEKLQALNLSGNNLDENWIRPGIFGGLHSLVVLDLSSNHLSRIESGLLSDTNALQYLNLGHNHIHTISASHAFASEAFASNIHTLVLSYNKLKALPDPQTLAGLSVLNTLGLDHNQLHSLHPSALRNCTVLEQISLNNNFLTEVPKSLHQMLELRSIDLSSNVIGFLKRESLQGLPKLSSLKLSNNELSRIGEGAFKEAPNLQHLDLSANRFISLEKNTFAILEKLTYLNIAENQIEDVNGLLTSQTNLRWLNISQNQLAWFDYAFIPDGLEWLDIHENAVDSLGNYHHLGDNYALKYVDARDNKIDRLEVLSILPSIQQMRLGNNKIKHIDPNTFLGKPNLTSIHLDNNQLNTLEMASLMVSLSPEKDPPMFYLANNPFRCDCRLSWLKRMHTYGLGTDGTSSTSSSGMATDLTTFHNVLQYPHVADLDLVTCKVINQTAHVGNQTFQKSLVSLQEKDFLCQYETHCLSLCLCCDFFACDCKMKCPEGCICYHDATWSTNVIQCSGGNKKEIPPLVPMDATVLHLQDNNLTSLESGMFLGRTRLKEIYLSSSHVKSVQNSTFAGLFHLEILHLGNNELTHISGREFDGLGGSLTHLYLQNNQLVSIADGAFKELEKLSVLQLDGNMLIAFPVWELTSNRQLTELRLSNNWWQCQCEFVRKFRMFIDAHIDVIPDAKRIKCTSMENGNSLTTSRRGQQCSDDMYSVTKKGTFADQLFNGDHDASLFIGIAVVLVGIIVITLFICRIKEGFQIWLHAKYGIRLRMKRQHARLTQANLNKSDASNDGCGTLFDAVVLYSMKDGPSVAEEMVKQLQPNGYKICFHHQDLPGIPYTSEALKSAITASIVHIVILSRAFLNTEWDLIKESGALYQLTDCVIIFTDTDSNTIKSDKENKKDVLAFIQAAKRTVSWNESALWRKLRFFLPDPTILKSPVRLASQDSTKNSVSKKTKLEGGAVLDTSGVWTFTPSINDGINDSGVSTTKLLLTPNGKESFERLNMMSPPTSFPAPPIRKKQPHQFSTHSVIGNISYNHLGPTVKNDYHQRSKSGGADTILDISLYNNATSNINALMEISNSKTRSCGTNANNHSHTRSSSAVNTSSPNSKNRYLSGSNNLINRKQLFVNLKAKENSMHSRSVSHIVQNTNRNDIIMIPIDNSQSGSQPHIYHKKSASHYVSTGLLDESATDRNKCSNEPPLPPPKIGRTKSNIIPTNPTESSHKQTSGRLLIADGSEESKQNMYDEFGGGGQSSFLHQLALSSQDNTLLNTLQRHNQQQNVSASQYTGRAKQHPTSNNLLQNSYHQKSISMITGPSDHNHPIYNRYEDHCNAYSHSTTEAAQEPNLAIQPKHIYAKHGRSVSTLVNPVAMERSPNQHHQRISNDQKMRVDINHLNSSQHQRSNSHVIESSSKPSVSSSNYLLESLITPEKKRFVVGAAGPGTRNIISAGNHNKSTSHLSAILNNQNQLQQNSRNVIMHKSVSNLYFMPHLNSNPNGVSMNLKERVITNDTNNLHKRSSSTPFEGFVL